MGAPSLGQFAALVEERFSFLEDHGFRRSPADERETPVGVSVAYVGKHVGFLISHDARDAQVALRVVRVRDGRLAETGQGGYSRDLVSYLVRHAGYRGGRRDQGAAATGTEPGALERMLESWAELLRREGGALLRDEAETLPRE